MSRVSLKFFLSKTEDEGGGKEKEEEDWGKLPAICSSPSMKQARNDLE